MSDLKSKPLLFFSPLGCFKVATEKPHVGTFPTFTFFSPTFTAPLLNCDFEPGANLKDNNLKSSSPGEPFGPTSPTLSRPADRVQLKKQIFLMTRHLWARLLACYSSVPLQKCQPKKLAPSCAEQTVRLFLGGRGANARPLRPERQEEKKHKASLCLLGADCENYRLPGSKRKLRVLTFGTSEGSLRADMCFTAPSNYSLVQVVQVAQQRCTRRARTLASLCHGPDTSGSHIPAAGSDQSHVSPGSKPWKYFFFASQFTLSNKRRFSSTLPTGGFEHVQAC